MTPSFMMLKDCAISSNQLENCAHIFFYWTSALLYIKICHFHFETLLPARYLMSKGLSKLFIGAILVFLGACTTSGPQQTLDEMAQAMERNNPSGFLAQIDMKTYASNYLKSLTIDDSALSSLNALGNALGLGNLDNFLDNIVDMQGRLTRQFETGVSSGELMAQCRVADTPDCPWVPQALRDAQIIELDQNAAIAKITTPARLTSWLALRKTGEKWLVVGHAVLESRAREFALKGSQPPASVPGQKAPAAKNSVQL